MVDRDAKAVIERVERLQQRRRARGASLVAAARSRLPELAAVVRDRFGVRRVILFGSFAHGTPTPHSDVDLAVEGLAAQDQLHLGIESE